MQRAYVRVSILLTVCLFVSTGVMLAVPRVPQPQGYHDFIDQRACPGIANCLNVISNAPFAVIGTIALLFLRRPSAPLKDEEQRAYTVLFIGVLLTSIGSAFYHLAPSNARLVWDRLPMTLGFMGLFAAVICERISSRFGRGVLSPLLLVGAASVAYWSISETRGVGDLRPYLLVQFLPLIAIPVILAALPAAYTHAGLMFLAIGLYAVAKVFEMFDAAVYSFGGIVSGHTLKHLLSAVAIYALFVMLKRRQPIRRTARAHAQRRDRLNDTRGRPGSGERARDDPADVAGRHPARDRSIIHGPTTNDRCSVEAVVIEDRPSHRACDRRTDAGRLNRVHDRRGTDAEMAPLHQTDPR